MNKNALEINAENFQTEVIESDKPCLVDFYSTECPPCEALAPKFESLADKFSPEVKFVKIFRQENRELADKLEVSSSPTLLFFKNGNEVYRRLSGGVQKSKIVEGIKELLSEEIFASLNTPAPIKKEEADLIILGAGPAGMAAAIYAAQAKLKTVLIDQGMPGGQVSTTHTISNYPGTGKAIPGYELVHNMQTQAEEAGALIYAAVEVNQVSFENTEDNENLKTVLIDNEIELSAPALILASGAEPRSLNIPGETEFKGSGISYCATCDGKYYDNKELIVIGGGNSAVEESLFLTKFASKITMVHQFDHLQANKSAQETILQNDKVGIRWDSEPRIFEKTSDGKMRVTIENIKTNERSTVEADGVFIFVGMSPNNSIIPSSIEVNEWGYIPTNENMETNVSGVYAVGDIREKNIRQAITAASDGAIAAIYAERHNASLKNKQDSLKHKSAVLV